MSMTIPDGTSYSFTYRGPIADSEDSLPASSGDQCLAGGVSSVTLPTRATISYDYQVYELPVSPCGLDPVALSSGIRTRVVHDPLNVSNDQTTQYVQSSTNLGGTVTCPGGTNANAGAVEYVNTVTVTTLAEPEVAQKTRYYFSVWHVNQLASNGSTVREYGLPFSRARQFDGRFLSTEVLDASSNPVRSTYLNYDLDFAVAIANQWNARISGSRTVFNDDDEAVSNSVGRHYADTSFTAFDGVGHYRTKTTSGDLHGSARTVTTPYNTVDPSVNPSALATGTYDNSTNGGSFVPPPTTAPWVLNLYPTTTTTETGTPAVQEACFNPANGFLSGTRARGGASRASNDFIAAFGSDSAATGGMAGAVTSEKYYGGDVYPLTSSLSQSLCDTVSATPGTLQYDIRHTYQYGVRRTSEYYSGGTTVGFKFLDQDIDFSTGLTTHSRDTAFVDTEYTYDSSRRVSTAKTGDDPVIHYTYTNPTTSAGANVTIHQTSTTSGTPQASFDYDGLGRLVLQSRTLPALYAGGPARWTSQKTIYDAMGRKRQVSEWEESSSPSHFTTSSGFDMFGRPGAITKPDGATTNFAYHGVRQIDRTSYIHTQSGPDSGATTTELYDLHGRLYQVNEPNYYTVTNYTYDVGGRLQGVSMAGEGTTQARTFSYDNRGLLMYETHPEVGSNGNGTTFYGLYDARGHAKSKTTGTANGPYDLRFTYDASERLTDVYDNGGARTLKHFDFAAANSGTNKQQGKLWQAVRTNHLAAGDIVVTENYKYEKPSGRTSSRETIAKNGTTTLQDYQQSFEYDDLGAITNPGYPSCLSGAPCSGTSGLTGATYAYRDGSLITIPNYATLSYTGNMLAQVDHQNGVSDLYRQDTSNGLARPASIAFTGVTTGCQIPSAPVITAASPVCAGSSGNTATVPSASVTYQWSIPTGGTITANNGTSITYTAGTAGPVTLSVTAANSCGTSPAGVRTVTVAPAPTATLSGTTTINPGQTATLHVALTGTSPWTVTWSDIGTQTVYVSFDRTVTPQTTTTYMIAAVSDSSAAPCNTNTSTTSAVVTVQGQQLLAPTWLTTTLLSDHVVRVAWEAVSGTGVTYRLERASCRSGCGWQTLVSSIAATSYDYSAPATAAPEAWLYHVVATASGATESQGSPYDYATTANILFAESIAHGTRIRGSHVSELRLAIDKLRAAASLPAYMTPAYSNGWSNYNAQTGRIYASQVLAMRAALSEAAAALSHPVSFSGETPAHGTRIYAYQFTDLRAGVK
jgi:hypothetical protein